MPKEPPVELSEHYRDLIEIGRGTTGVVYRARFLPLKRDVAIKVSLPEDWRNRHRLTRECQLMAAMNRNPDVRVPKVHELGKTGDETYLVREFVDGQTLEQAILSESLDVRVGMQVVADVAVVISHLHSRGAVHRNLHPSNILVTGDGRATLIGFGRVRTVEHSQSFAPDIDPLYELPGYICRGLGEPLPKQLQHLHGRGSERTPELLTLSIESFLAESP